MRASNVRLVYLHATRETKAYLDAIDPVDAEDGHKADTLLGVDVIANSSSSDLASGLPSKTVWDLIWPRQGSCV